MNLLITGAWKCDKTALETICNLGNDVTFLDDETKEMPVPYEWVEGIIANGIFLSHPIERFINLRFIQLTSAGFDRVPMDYVRQHGIEIHNARGVYSIPIAESVICNVLQLYRASNYYWDNRRRRVWEKRRNLKELNGKRIVIVGCGSVGTACARLFKAFGCRVYGVDMVARTDINFDAISPIDDLKSSLHDADVVVLTVPLTPETYHLFDFDMLTSMRSDSILVNVARGKVVDTVALVRVLQEKMISGVALDVFEQEPLEADSPLWNFDNVILTPHVSFIGDGNSNRLDKVIISNLEKAISLNV